MATRTVNISFRADLLKQIDKVARAQSRTRSELVREAARAYVERKQLRDAQLKALQKEITAGLDQADRGRTAPLDAAAIKAKARRRKRTKR